MLKYGKNIIFNPKKLNSLNIDRQSVSFIPQGSRVLEIGCATGFMGEYFIKKKHCEVIGVEKGKEEAKIARTKLTQVVEGDIENIETIQKLELLGKFDVVFASALIEHLKDPWKAIKTWKRFLKRNGVLIITTSNIAHWSIRFHILRGRFDYEEYGILDNTHLRFFTVDTFKKLVVDSGYIIDHFSIDPVGGGFPKISKMLSKLWPNLFAYQMLVVAKPHMRMNPNKNNSNEFE